MKATQKPAQPASDVQVTPADILRGAAAYLQLNGWIKGYFFDLSMNPGPAFPPACTGSAICTAAIGHPFTPGDLPSGPDGTNALRALVAFAGYIVDYAWDFDYVRDAASDIVADWNDEAERTFTEVKAALEDAAAQWDHVHPAVTP
ncbi:hypothetical protein AB0J82_12655 [Asanoa sp. NPDC049518]|uniref:DUF6197 family protein n=1 Tax=unclassified Asanoa TaxID=2685164 RepID=UPI003419E99C